MAHLYSAAYGVSSKMDFLPLAHVRTDPIVVPQCLSDHVHTYYGATASLRPETTYEDLMAAKGNSGNVKENLSLYWHPTVRSRRCSVPRARTHGRYCSAFCVTLRGVWCAALQDPERQVGDGPCLVRYRVLRLAKRYAQESYQGLPRRIQDDRGSHGRQGASKLHLPRRACVRPHGEQLHSQRPNAIAVPGPRR